LSRFNPKYFLLALPVLFLGCQKASETPGVATVRAEALAAPKWDDAVTPDRVVDDTARFLAGMPGTEGSPFANMQSDTVWQEHKQAMDAAWARADEKLIHGLKEFQQSELSTPPLDTNEVFYPFSGPDALTETLEFPHSPTYFMVALEPAGSLPSVAYLQKKPMKDYLGAIRTTVASVLGKSFFITREMDSQFRGQVTDGLLVPVLLLLVRTDHTVVGFKYERIDEKGLIVERPDNAHVDAKYANKGFTVEFRNNGDKSLHRIYYFSANLDNKHLPGNTGFMHYAAAMPPHTTLLKATSYMTHHDDFSAIRDLVVNQSAAVFQDDSGIPYHFFEPGKWNIQLYGEYTKPYEPFSYMVEPDLRKAYEAGDVKPLSMRLGYGFGKVTSNLLLARKN
jgi:hypothetical protein